MLGPTGICGPNAPGRVSKMSTVTNRCGSVSDDVIRQRRGLADAIALVVIDKRRYATCRIAPSMVAGRSGRIGMNVRRAAATVRKHVVDLVTIRLQGMVDRCVSEGTARRTGVL